MAMDQIIPHAPGVCELLLMSAVRLARAAVPAMRESGGGSIVFIGSASVREPPPHLLLP